MRSDPAASRGTTGERDARAPDRLWKKAPAPLPPDDDADGLARTTRRVPVVIPIMGALILGVIALIWIGVLF